jgi:hypothetical protein
MPDFSDWFLLVIFVISVGIKFNFRIACCGTLQNGDGCINKLFNIILIIFMTLKRNGKASLTGAVMHWPEFADSYQGVAAQLCLADLPLKTFLSDIDPL